MYTRHYTCVTFGVHCVPEMQHLATFSELLTAYMTRTGITDADLARRVGVNRLTLVRWKEGVTSRPRYREDVVKCAEVLRLTAEEGDELLLAAGFHPESPEVPAGPLAPVEVEGRTATRAG